ncbi:MAG: peptidoglycan DD-metalloendopeptidase family protein [Chitinophagaceae bacterium]|nr:peptidoglycan DD-metalloendopeptidase family protein [Chitinophagaceae bacterium]
MVRKVFLIVNALLFIMGSVRGQVEKGIHQKTFDAFEKYYNSGSYDSVFSMFSGIMKTALPLNTTITNFTGLKQQAGRIVKREFMKYENDNSALYKTQFERAFFAISVLLDDSLKINKLLIERYQEDTLAQPDRNTTTIILPFNDEWTVVWGGDTKELNHHVENRAQKNAFDMVIKNGNGKSFRTDGTSNSDYYAFGKELFAPCDGVVVLAVDGVKDNKPGEMNRMYLPGNTVVIRTGNNEFLYFAHFKQRSIEVSEGQVVKRGQLLGLCGNSGNSSEPHLHFHIQNSEDVNLATGIKCFFHRILVNGQVKTGYSPVQNEKIRNVLR